MLLSCSCSYWLKCGSPRSGITRIDRICDLGAMPMTRLPPPSWPCPAIGDASQVPCTPQSGLDGLVVTPVSSGPVTTDLVRSLTYGFTPLSITATVTPPPSVSNHAACTSSRSRTHCSLSLMLSAATEPEDRAPACSTAAPAVPGSTAGETTHHAAARASLRLHLRFSIRALPGSAGGRARSPAWV